MKGPLAGNNPWHVRGLEWKTSSPPPEHNFHERRIEVPKDYEPYDYWRPEIPS